MKTTKAPKRGLIRITAWIYIRVNATRVKATYTQKHISISMNEAQEIYLHNRLNKVFKKYTSEAIPEPLRGILASHNVLVENLLIVSDDFRAALVEEMEAYRNEK